MRKVAICASNVRNTTDVRTRGNNLHDDCDENFICIYYKVFLTNKLLVLCICVLFFIFLFWLAKKEITGCSVSFARCAYERRVENSIEWVLLLIGSLLASS